MTLGEWDEQLTIALDHGMPHLSAYCLTVETRTALAHQVKKGLVAMPEDDDQSAQFDRLMERMEAAGLGPLRDQQLRQARATILGTIRATGMAPPTWASALRLIPSTATRAAGTFPITRSTSRLAEGTSFCERRNAHPCNAPTSVS
jgi:hypothetical protein